MKFEVKEVEDYGDKFKITATTEVDGVTYSERFGFDARQYETGSWKEHIESWVQRMHAEHSLQQADLESEIKGEEFEVKDNLSEEN